jgi:8-hydroxy-5-deazaflavin:NADPH oxidoreductase
LLAAHWSRIADVVKEAGDLSGKVIVTCSLPMNADNTELVVAHTCSGAEEVAKMVPKTRIVAAFANGAERSAFQRERSQAQGQRSESGVLWR